MPGCRAHYIPVVGEIVSALPQRGAGDGFRHEALFYGGEDEFVARGSAFIRAGIARAEPTLVVVTQRKTDMLREELDRASEAVYFADMAEVGHNPARIIPAWREFAAAHASSKTGVRGVGEPIFPERGPEELVECQRHEALLNVAFADSGPFWLLCPYDVDALDAIVIEEARRTHPFLALRERHEKSREYLGVDALSAPFAEPLPEPPSDAVEYAFTQESLHALRDATAEWARRAGLAEKRIAHLVLAINEVASNSVRHGGGRGDVRFWRHDGRLVCEIRDGGHVTDPLAGRELPATEEPGARGLWIANKLCDLVQIRSYEWGTIVRLQLTTLE
jgi:anti-sigma regulatory factor (Ser/Thr protein kinase)